MTTPSPDNDPLSVTSHELAYLLSLNLSAESTAIRERLSLTDPSESPAEMSAGAATLLVRGLAYIQDCKLVPTEESALLGYVLTTAHRWIEVGLDDRGTLDGALILAAEGVSLMLVPRPLGIYEVVAIDSDTTPGTIVERMVTTFVDGAESPFVVVRAGGDGEERSVALLRNGSRWRTAPDIPRPSEPGGVDLAEDAFSDTDRERALAAVVTVVTA